MDRPALHTSPPSSLLLLLPLFFLCACGGEEAQPAGERGELTETVCSADSECDDGALCNGEETCDEGFCRLGTPLRCDDGIDCTTDSCSHASNGCIFTPQDADRDGHADASCTGPDGDALGDDCDDEDPNRFPGNPEICEQGHPTHDEDCDPKTFGHLDEDLDGETSAACCNEDGDSKLHCGSDCDDSDYRRATDYPEICDDIDNDCDGKVDVDTKEVPWFPDADGDHFGDGNLESILSCAPVEGHSLRPTDCNDEAGAVHNAARETCDGVDNDCDGDVDEDGVCTCTTEGQARACACDALVNGIQICEGGLWDTCDCSECINGTVDCVGELLPRECVGGRWVTKTACSGLKPICLDGSCHCADGSKECEDVNDVFRPSLLDSNPRDGEIIPESTQIALQLSESVDVDSARAAIKLTNVAGEELPIQLAFAGDLVAILPDDELLPAQPYKLTLTTELSDLSGNTLERETLIAFETSTGLEVSRVAGEDATNFTTPVLAMSENGSNLLFARRGGTPPGDVPFVWDGDKWQSSDPGLPTNSTISLGIDDSGAAVGLFTRNNEISSIPVSSGVLGSSTLLTSMGTSTYRALVTPSGQALSLFSFDGSLRLQSGSSDGNWNAPYFVPNSASGISRSVLETNQAGQAMLFYDDEKGSHTHRSTASFATWSEAEEGGPPESVVSVIGTVLETGEGVLMWIESVLSNELFYTQTFMQRLDTNASWVGQPTRVGIDGGDRNERTPSVGHDLAGNLFYAFKVGQDLYVVRERAGGQWEDELRVNAAPATQISEYRLEVATNGDALITWIQTIDKANRLWSRRYIATEGWQPARLLENDGIAISTHRTKLDASGSALVVFQRGLSFADQDLFSVAF